ncbi:uncharacterized protein E0L32_010939 [Thyridium curvatum]|uniref:Uncharacterized protein n=1 Tax=Thyridium curvatum TaxID=1093900 RepID=A0A507AQI1_9PEZI|nr:uncharacterized protein E0L32_010939 [Thyridium curvatum]TPX07138.1 hypothetical protein E0L32_010939 [Thyridium curvatum]
MVPPVLLTEKYRIENCGGQNRTCKRPPHTPQDAFEWAGFSSAGFLETPFMLSSVLRSRSADDLPHHHPMLPTSRLRRSHLSSPAFAPNLGEEEEEEESSLRAYLPILSGSGILAVSSETLLFGGHSNVVNAAQFPHDDVSITSF